MCADSSYKKTSSPRSSTEVSSLQVDRLKNKEALERRLQCRRTIKELVNQGILLNPSISHPDKVLQLQRAKVSDLLKHKIEKRPDRQSLINRRIIRDDKPGASPYILEQCHNLEKNSLRNSLKSKLNARPGSLELIEKGVLQVDPGIDSLVRTGSIQYPRVEPVPAANDTELLNPLLSACGKSLDPSFCPIAPKPTSAPKPKPSRQSSGAVNVGRSTMKDETYVYKVGSLVFHNYCPKSSQLLSPRLSTNTSFQQRQKAREAQQAEMLRLQDSAGVSHCDGMQVGHQDCLQPSMDASPSLNVSPSNDVPMCSPMAWTLTPSDTLPPVNSALSSEVIDQASPSPGASLISTSSVTDSTPSLKSLEQLSCVRLRAECQERNLPRNGNKAFLIRQLEPYSDEILTKYSRQTRRIKSTVPPEHRPPSSTPNENSQVSSASSRTSIQWPPSVHPGQLVQLRPITPRDHSAATPTPVTTFPVVLRHSSSAPFIVEGFQPVSASTQESTGPLLSLLAPGSSTVPKSSTIQVSSDVNMCDYRASSSTSTPQSLHSTPAPCPVSPTESSQYHSTLPKQPRSDASHPLGPFHHIIESNMLLRSLPNSGDQSVAASDIHTPTAADSTASGSEASWLAPSLGQIEEVWLQVRKLRRQLAKDPPNERAGSETHSDMWDQVQTAQRHRLQQEHDRLIVLCRLLVVDRMDALDDLLDSGMDSSSSDSAIQAGYSSASQLQLERNLLLSYLRKLGGAEFVERVSSPSERYRRSSSPVSYDPTCLSRIVQSDTLRTYHTTSSTSRLPLDAEFPSSLTNSTMHQAFSWSEGLQQGKTDNPAHDSPSARPFGLDNSIEPTVSPLNTDAMFELWHTLLKDSPPQETTKEQTPPETHQRSPDCSVSSGSTQFGCQSTVNEPQHTLHFDGSTYCANPNSETLSSSNQIPRDRFMNDSSQSVASTSRRAQSTTQVPSLNAFAHAQVHNSALYYPQPYPYPFTGNSGSTTGKAKNSNESTTNPHWTNPGGKVPVEQMADALFCSLDTADFAELMDVSEAPVDLCRASSKWSTGR